MRISLKAQTVNKKPVGGHWGGWGGVVLIILCLNATENYSFKKNKNDPQLRSMIIFYYVFGINIHKIPYSDMIKKYVFKVQKN